MLVGRYGAVLDANILYSATLRGALLRMAQDRLFRLFPDVDAIVTFNTKDFPTGVAADLGIEIRHPDAFLVNIDLDPARALKAFRMQREALKNPPMAADEFLQRLGAAGLLQTQLRLADYVGLL